MDELFEKFSIDDIKIFLDKIPNPVAFTKRDYSDSNQPNDHVIYLNQAFISILGFTLDDIPTSLIWFEKAYPDPIYQKSIMHQWEAAIINAKSNNQNLIGFPAKVTCKNGGMKWVQFSAHIGESEADEHLLVSCIEIDSPDEVVKQFQDRTTQLMENYEELANKDCLLKEQQSLAQIGSWEIDLQTGGITWSDQMYVIFGEDRGKYIPTMEGFYSRLSKADQKYTQQKIEQVVATGTDQSVIVQSKRSDGTPITLEIHGRAENSEDGQPIAIIGSTMDISQRTELEAQNRELANLMRVAQQELYIVDYETDQYLYANEAATNNTGYSNEEILNSDIYLLNPFLTPEIVKQLKSQAEDRTAFENNSVHQRKDGSHYPVHAYLQAIFYQNRPCYAIFDADISELKIAEETLQSQVGLLQNIIDTVPVRIYWKDREGKYLGANQLFLEDAQLDSDERLIGKTDFELHLNNGEARRHREEDLRVINSGSSKLHYQESQINSEGQSRVLSRSKVPMVNAKGEITGILGAYEDITSRLEIEETVLQQQEELHYQANYDHLTGLPNRALLKDRIEHAIYKSKRNMTEFAVLFLDLDQFKQINDSMGHAFGDKVLQKIAERFRAVVRESDTLARLGGDEFTIVMEEFSHLNEITTLAQKLIDDARKSLVVEGQQYYMTTSIGISLYPRDAKDEEQLLKCADAAMYRAKDSGRDNYQFYTEDMTLSAFEHVAMQASLRGAIKNREFEVYFQPQIDSKNSKIIGCEALARWQHPLLGVVLPGKFISLAEDIGLIVQLDRLIMELAIGQWAQWEQQGIDAGCLSINLSVKQSQSKDFVDYLKSLISQTGCQIDKLCFELTETDVMKNIEDVRYTLNQLSEMGIKIAVDDFGTGYSSLANLKRLPVNKLKIDRSFVMDLPDDEEDKAITRTIISMALTLGLEVIAEGVETLEQEQFLLESGCYEVQGYYYSRPVPAEQALEFIKGFK